MFFFLPSFLFRPSYCSVEGEFLFSLPPFALSLPGWGKRGSADPSRTSTSDPTCPETERRAPETPPRLVPTRERGGGREAAAPPRKERASGLGRRSVGRSLRRDRRSRSPQRARQWQRHSQCFLARDPLARGTRRCWDVGGNGRKPSKISTSIEAKLPNTTINMI